ncbi:MULE transposase domain [Sesbania bispinosa]|nr:MULE transposase domain [Sesbania bispinosa]
MFNKVPKAVVTDGDGAMRKAIRTVFPGSFHRLCSWHLHQNACENVKNLKFLEDFKKIIYANFTPEKFEQEWLRVVEKHGLNNNKWVRKVYDMKRIWATTYFRENFFAGIRTTSIYEASDYKSTYTQPLLTIALEKYEVQACNVYIKNKFFVVRKEIEKVAALNMIDRLFESIGLPCPHIFCAMKHEQIESIPSSLICKRWTKFAKVDHTSAIYAEAGDTSRNELLRSGVVVAACNRLNKVAHKNAHNFVKNIEAIHHLADRLERQDGAKVNIAEISKVVRDPTIVKTKGAPHKSKKMMKKKGNAPIVSVQDTQLGHVPSSQLEISCTLLKKRNLLWRVVEIQGIKL